MRFRTSICCIETKCAASSELGRLAAGGGPPVQNAPNFNSTLDERRKNHFPGTLFAGPERGRVYRLRFGCDRFGCTERAFLVGFCAVASGADRHCGLEMARAEVPRLRGHLRA